MQRVLHSRTRSGSIPVMFLAMILLWLPGSALPAVAQSDLASQALATTTVELATGTMTWRAAGQLTIADDGAPLALAPGFVYALDDPLVVTLEGDGRQERIQAGEAVALSGEEQAKPVAMVAGSPIPFVTIELLDAANPENPEAVTFDIKQGEYNLTLWQLDLSKELPEDAVKQMSNPQLPFLVIVRQGEVDVPARAEGEPPRRLAMGEWVVLTPHEKLAMAPDTAPPVLLVAMLTQPERTTTPPAAPATGSGMSGPAGSQGSLPAGSSQVRGAPAQPTIAPTAVPTTPPTIVTEPTTEPAVPTMEPTVPPPPPADTSSSSGEAPGSNIGSSGCTGSDLVASCVDDTPLLLPTAEPVGLGDPESAGVWYPDSVSQPGLRLAAYFPETS